MIKINDIQEPICELYDKNDNLIGEIKSMLQMTDIRVQHKEQGIKAGNYYFLFKGKRIDIDINGTLSDYPTGFYDTYTNQLMKLI